MPELTDRDRAILHFEDSWTRDAGRKEAAIREQFGFSFTRYHQELGRIIHEPGAVQAYPSLTKRLQQARAERAEKRAKRTFS